MIGRLTGKEKRVGGFDLLWDDGPVTAEDTLDCSNNITAPAPNSFLGKLHTQTYKCHSTKCGNCFSSRGIQHRFNYPLMCGNWSSQRGSLQYSFNYPLNMWRMGVWGPPVQLLITISHAYEWCLFVKLYPEIVYCIRQHVHNDSSGWFWGKWFHMLVFAYWVDS